MSAWSSHVSLKGGWCQWYHLLFALTFPQSKPKGQTVAIDLWTAKQSNFSHIHLHFEESDSLSKSKCDLPSVKMGLRKIYCNYTFCYFGVWINIKFAEQGTSGKQNFQADYLKRFSAVKFHAGQFQQQFLYYAR